jgi:hypothetical protein
MRSWRHGHSLAQPETGQWIQGTLSIHGKRALRHAHSCEWLATVSGAGVLVERLPNHSPTRRWDFVAHRCTPGHARSHCIALIVEARQARPKTTSDRPNVAVVFVQTPWDGLGRHLLQGATLLSDPISQVADNQPTPSPRLSVAHGLAAGGSMQHARLIEPGLAWRGQAWRGLAWPGLAWPGLAWPGLAWRHACATCVYGRMAHVRWAGRARVLQIDFPTLLPPVRLSLALLLNPFGVL